MKFKLPKNVSVEHYRVKNDKCSVPILILKNKDKCLCNSLGLIDDYNDSQSSTREVDNYQSGQRNSRRRRTDATSRCRQALGLWIHGGGFLLGMKEMAFMGRAVDLVSRYGVTIVSPGYTLSFQKPYPQALIDCYSTLVWMNENKSKLVGGLTAREEDPILFVGGESAGGGLCASVCLLARDLGQVKVDYQFPLYPMIDNFETESSVDNHGKVWNTARNRMGWKSYLRDNAKKSVSPYASPAHVNDFSNLPPCYTFVGDGEPFYRETLDFVENLKKAGVNAECDVYHTDVHAFDMMLTKNDESRKAVEKFERVFCEEVLG